MKNAVLVVLGKVLSLPILAIYFFLSPLGLLRKLLYRLQATGEMKPIIRGTLPDDWERCCSIWKERNLVEQFAGHVHKAPLGHQLAVELARMHQSDPRFFESKLGESDPMVAAYAFKCLIRIRKPDRSSIPSGLLMREDTISVLWADLVKDQTLCSFVNGWLDEQERIEARLSAIPWGIRQAVSGWERFEQELFRLSCFALVG